MASGSSGAPCPSGIPSESQNSSQGSPPQCPFSKVDPRNMEPNYSQSPCANQSIELSTERIVSSIPKCNESKTQWVYPSPQQFFNALKRKGKDAPEEHVPVMVDIHNFLNENCWHEIKKWESLFHSDCDDISLWRLRGRSEDLSPSAAFYHYVLGSQKPFDRHDWVLKRCGKEVRYVIDYYSTKISGENNSAEFSVFVRPALDSPASIIDRLKMFFMNLTK